MASLTLDVAALLRAYESLPEPRPKLEVSDLIVCDGVTHLYSDLFENFGCTNPGLAAQKGNYSRGPLARGQKWCEACLQSTDVFFSDFTSPVRLLQAVSVLNGPNPTRADLELAFDTLKHLKRKSTLKQWRALIETTFEDVTVRRVAYDQANDPLFKPHLLAGLVDQQPHLFLEATEASSALLQVSADDTSRVILARALAGAAGESIKSQENSYARRSRLRRAFDLAVPEAPTSISQLAGIPGNLLDPTSLYAADAVHSAWRQYVNILLESALVAWDESLDALAGPPTHLVAVGTHRAASDELQDFKERMGVCWPSWRQEDKVVLHVPERIAHLRDSRSVRTVPCPDNPPVETIEAALTLWEPEGTTFSHFPDAYEAAGLAMR